MSFAHRILSGVRPTGHIHLGNYLGAIRQWVALSKTVPEQLFCIVDQHALTTLEDAENLAQNTRTIAAAYIACGIDPHKSSIFVQSHVPAHTELGWYLGCLTPLGWLNRMTQFKDKAGKNQDLSCLGLYAYPVLMAADILIYKATHVPVGDDQKQHVELARDIAGAFNRRFGQDFFPLPEPIIQQATARIMSLRDGSKKMSKSEISDYSRIHLLDDDDTIALKVRKAKTDSEPIPATTDALTHRPEALNLLTIYSVLAKQSLDQTCSQFTGKLFSDVKGHLVDILVQSLSPIRQEMLYLLKDPEALDQIFKKGADKANAIAQQNLKEVRTVLGLLPA